LLFWSLVIVIYPSQSEGQVLEFVICNLGFIFMQSCKPCPLVLTSSLWKRIAILHKTPYIIKLVCFPEFGSRFING
jgi:hypothetical protein